MRKSNERQLVALQIVSRVKSLLPVIVVLSECCAYLRQYHRTLLFLTDGVWFTGHRLPINLVHGIVVEVKRE